MTAARRDPNRLVIGIDADAASMRHASRKASRSPKKGGLPNALFVVSAVEALPEELTAIADDVRIAFPWGSLLRGVVGRDAAVLAAIAAIAKPGAGIRAFVSVLKRAGVNVTVRDTRGRTIDAACGQLASSSHSTS